MLVRWLVQRACDWGRGLGISPIRCARADRSLVPGAERHLWAAGHFGGSTAVGAQRPDRRLIYLADHDMGEDLQTAKLYGDVIARRRPTTNSAMSCLIQTCPDTVRSARTVCRVQAKIAGPGTRMATSSQISMRNGCEMYFPVPTARYARTCAACWSWTASFR